VNVWIESLVSCCVQAPWWCCQVVWARQTTGLVAITQTDWWWLTAYWTWRVATQRTATVFRASRWSTRSVEAPAAVSDACCWTRCVTSIQIASSSHTASFRHRRYYKTIVRNSLYQLCSARTMNNSTRTPIIANKSRIRGWNRLWSKLLWPIGNKNLDRYLISLQRFVSPSRCRAYSVHYGWEWQPCYDRVWLFAVAPALVVVDLYYSKAWRHLHNSADRWWPRG